MAILGILGNNGEIDRKVLSSIVFSDKVNSMFRLQCYHGNVGFFCASQLLEQVGETEFDCLARDMEPRPGED